jgi:hypothetical protein
MNETKHGYKVNKSPMKAKDKKAKKLPHLASPHKQTDPHQSLKEDSSHQPALAKA